MASTAEVGIPPLYNVYALKSLRYRNANSSYEQGLDIDIIDFMDPVCSITDTAYPIALPVTRYTENGTKKSITRYHVPKKSFAIVNRYGKITMERIMERCIEM